MNIQEMLGDAYHEGMTIDEMNAALSGKKFADLSTGAYVDKNKYDAENSTKDAEIKKLREELNAKMSDEEKTQQAQNEKDALIESLKQQIKIGNMNTSKSNAESLLAESKSILGIKDGDKDYGNFIASISGEDLESTKTLAKYINNLVKDSYEKGKKDASKDNLGNFAKGISTGSSESGKGVENYGKIIANLEKTTDVDANMYFKDKK